MGILMSYWDSSLLHSGQEASPVFHHSSSSSLVTGWHGNCMMLNCWMHGWKLEGSFFVMSGFLQLMAVLFIHCFLISQTVSNLFYSCHLWQHIFFFSLRCALLMTYQDIVWKPQTPWYFTALSHIVVLMTCGNPRAFWDNAVRAGRL